MIEPKFLGYSCFEMTCGKSTLSGNFAVVFAVTGRSCQLATSTTLTQGAATEDLDPEEATRLLEVLVFFLACFKAVAVVAIFLAFETFLLEGKTSSTWGPNLKEFK